MPNQPKSPAKRKQPPTGPQEKTARTTRSQAAGQHEVASSQTESPTKEKTKCRVCGKEFLLFLSHLKRSKPCATEYDVVAMEAEDQIRRREHRQTPEKRAASREAAKKYRDNNRAASREASKKYYDSHTPEKMATMTAYNEIHRGGINQAMRQLNFNPDKREEKKQTNQIFKLLFF